MDKNISHAIKKYTFQVIENGVGKTIRVHAETKELALEEVKKKYPDSEILFLWVS